MSHLAILVALSAALVLSIAALAPTAAAVSPLASLSPPAPAGAPLRGVNDGYVGCSSSDDCYAFDLTTYVTGSSINILPEADYPYDATMNPAGTEVWIPGASGDGVVVIDRMTNAVTHRIAVGEYAISVVFTDDGNLALVSSRDDDIITLIDTSTYSVTDTLHVGRSTAGIYDSPGNMALDPLSKRIYVADWYGEKLYEIAPDGSSVLREAVIGTSLWQLVVSLDGQHIYVTDRGTDEIRVIDQSTLTQIRTVAVGDDPWGIDITRDGDTLVVACEDSHEAYIVDTNTWQVTPILLAVDADPRDVDILDAEQLAFIPGGRVGTTSPVFVLDLSAAGLLTSFDVPGSNTNVIAVQPQMTSAMTGVQQPHPAALTPRLQSSPNPFNPHTTIRYALSEQAEVELAVFDARGRRVASLESGHRTPGDHEVIWDGRDTRGNQVSSGVYFVKLRAGAAMGLIKIVLLE